MKKYKIYFEVIAFLLIATSLIWLIKDAIQARPGGIQDAFIHLGLFIALTLYSGWLHYRKKNKRKKD